jgi:hypothetical protein
MCRTTLTITVYNINNESQFKLYFNWILIYYHWFPVYCLTSSKHYFRCIHCYQHVIDIDNGYV